MWMSVHEFVSWNPPSDGLWQLVDGEPRLMAPATRTHGAIQSELGRLIGNHLEQRSGHCTVVTAPGVIPRVQSEANFRVPGIAVTCSPYETEEQALTDPILLIEILSPSNQAETWANIWTYATVPSVREILIVRSTAIGVELLRRNVDGTWPERPRSIDGGILKLDSIGLQVEVAAIYRTTRLSDPAGRRGRL